MSKCHIVENLMHWIIVGNTPSEFGSEGKAYLYTSCDDFEDVKADELYKYMWGLCLASAPSSDNISLPGAQAGGSIITESILQDDTKCKYKRYTFRCVLLNSSPHCGP